MINQTKLRLGKILIVLITLTGVNSTGSYDRSEPDQLRSEISEFKQGLIHSVMCTKLLYSSMNSCVDGVMAFLIDTELSAFRKGLIHSVICKRPWTAKIPESLDRTLVLDLICSFIPDLVPMPGVRMDTWYLPYPPYPSPPPLRPLRLDDREIPEFQLPESLLSQQLRCWSPRRDTPALDLSALLLTRLENILQTPSRLELENSISEVPTILPYDFASILHNDSLAFSSELQNISSGFENSISEIISRLPTILYRRVEDTTQNSIPSALSIEPRAKL